MNRQPGIRPLVMIVEDHFQIVELIEYYLKPHFDLIVAESRAQALALLQTHTPDLIILDIGLNDGRDSGYTLLETIRESGVLGSLAHLAGVPIIMLTARREPVDGLNRGADDYITKPFDGRELLARVHARIRPRSVSLVRGPLSMNYRQREARLAGAPIELSRIEFDLLYLLASDPERVFSYKDIYEPVWKQRYLKASDPAIRMQIKKLRDSLGTPYGDMVVSVRGEGYRFVELRPDASE